MLLTSLSNLLASVLPFLSLPPHPARPSSSKDVLTFTLRHEHGQRPDGRVVFADVPEHHASKLIIDDETVFTLKARPMMVHRPRSMDLFHRARRRVGASTIPWDPIEVIAPDTTSRRTLSLLSKMTFNAYLKPEDKTWYDLGSDWTVGYPFGWEPDENGFRGHVFATPDNRTVVLSIKGTTLVWPIEGGPTSKADKLNDNLLFSCCCARVNWRWSTVCNCYKGGWKCDATCLETAVTQDSLFYSMGTDLYSNLTYMYPYSTIWLTGHSLGVSVIILWRFFKAANSFQGALASLLGTTFGTPVVAFEAPGDALAASRLHLPIPNETSHITHVFHTADSIAMGVCNGVTSPCAMGGYAMESRCHLGQKIVYDTVGQLGWSVGIGAHSISQVIEKILNKPWMDLGGKIDLGEDGVPPAVPEDEGCATTECYSWDFIGSLQNANSSTAIDCGY
ncbi:alpha/beta-hydrolase [Auriculariales sp. MPI-PUGE-AT-0066]|nr:alpha/beta-hydrolase [Auriculariales sp. MPI-PUGE-AT-0066]